MRRGLEAIRDTSTDGASRQLAESLLAMPDELDGEKLIRSLERVKRVARKADADIRPEDIGFDVGVAAAQDAIRTYLHENT